MKLRPTTWSTALLCLGLLVVLLYVYPIARVTLRAPIGAGEGWVVLRIAAVRDHLPLYGSGTGFAVTGLPPLSFHLLALLARFGCDPNVAGRSVSLAALFLSAINLALLARRLGARGAASLFAGLYYLGAVAATAPGRIGMNDPHFLGCALATLGVLAFSEAVTTRFALTMSAAFFGLALSIDLSVAAFPLACLAMMIARTRRSASVDDVDAPAAPAEHALPAGAADARRWGMILVGVFAGLLVWGWLRDGTQIVRSLLWTMSPRVGSGAAIPLRFALLFAVPFGLLCLDRQAWKGLAPVSARAAGWLLSASVFVALAAWLLTRNGAPCLDILFAMSLAAGLLLDQWARHREEQGAARPFAARGLVLLLPVIVMCDVEVPHGLEALSTWPLVAEDFAGAVASLDRARGVFICEDELACAEAIADSRRDAAGRRLLVATALRAERQGWKPIVAGAREVPAIGAVLTGFADEESQHSPLARRAASVVDAWIGAGRKVVTVYQNPSYVLLEPDATRLR